MCGRMSITQPLEAMARLFDATPANDLPVVPNYNVCPTVNIHTVISAQGTRHLKAMRWGFVPHWYQTMTDGPLLINARSETLAEKPAFREAFQKRRCVIAADGFYEWKTITKGKTKQPFHIHRPDGAPFAFAGLWERWEKDGEPIETCTIITTDAPESLTDIHHRVPVILPQDAMAAWLETPEGQADGLAEFLVPLPDGELVAQPVSTAVNKVANDGPQCQEPVELEEPEEDQPKTQGDLFG